jgi:quinone-reactive Ni/Fe-hydrogenase large subunit
MKKIIIDPITRIEGHLRVEVEVDEQNIIQEAWASGQLFRGIEIIMQGKDPRDTPLVAQRICGVCTNSHYRASTRATEDAYKIEIPKNAKIIRDLVSLSLFIQDHIVHYYHLHSFDFVDVVSALSADPAKASQIAYQFSKNPYRNSVDHLSSVKQKLVDFVNAGKLGIFSNGYWGHETYKFSPEENLLHMSHYFEALRIQREISAAIAIFGGKTPHPQYMVIGGVTSIMDMLSASRVNDFMAIMKNINDFIQRAYIPDMKMLCNAYADELKNENGSANGNFMCVGGYNFGRGDRIFESGVIFDFDFANICDFDESKITEEANRAWYENEAKTSPLDGDTKPFYTDLNDDGSLKTEGKYSWIKAPRYDGKAMEVGPLSRMVVGWAKNSKVIKPYVQDFLDEFNISIKQMCGTIGRNAARALEAQICSEFIFDFVNDLLENVKYYDEKVWTKYDFASLPANAKGRGIFEVPRGVLAHFINIENASVKNYQAVVPTTWNASPKDELGKRGAYEESLIGIKLADTTKPLEVLRVIHSFDPCIACAVHIIDTKTKKELAKYKVNSVL